jgi:hypothetical protein
VVVCGVVSADVGVVMACSLPRDLFISRICVKILSRSLLGVCLERRCPSKISFGGYLYYDEFK